MTDYGFGPGVGLFESIALINKQKEPAIAKVEPVAVVTPAPEKPKRKTIPKPVRENYGNRLSVIIHSMVLAIVVKPSLTYSIGKPDISIRFIMAVPTN